MLRYVMRCDVTLCFVVLCYVVLRYVTLRYSVLCYVVLCYVLVHDITDSKSFDNLEVRPVCMCTLITP
jgi:hypothetical protein